MIQLKHLIWYLRKYYYLFLVFPVLLAGVVMLLTVNSSKIYDSHMVIYTGISTRKNADLTESLKVDFFTSNNLMDNIISLISSRKSIEEVSLRLLAQHLSLKETDPSVISEQSLEELKNHISEALKSQLRVAGNPDRTLANIIRYMDENHASPFHYLLENHPHYGIDEILERVRVDRKKNSDMIEISYYLDDPGIVFHTVDLLGEVYLKRYGELRYNETSSSVDYFQSQLDVVMASLNDSEEKLKEFISKNRIMNYYEQGKSLDLYRKEVEAEQSNAVQIAMGAEASLIKLEERLAQNLGRSDVLDSISLYRNNVSQLRVRLNTLVESDPGQSALLKEEIHRINEKVNEKINRLYRQDFSVDGVPMNNLLLEWLNLYIEKEKQMTASEISLKALKNIDQRIDGFAPLGAELNRLEREVHIHENEYLAIIHGLNQARIQKENIKLSQSQVVVDPPFFPTNPRTSKRKILVAASFFFGNILVLAFLTVKLITDYSLREPKRAMEITGLNMAGAFPAAGKRTDNPGLEATVFEYWLNELNLRMSTVNKEGPFLIGLLLKEEKQANLQLVQGILGFLARKKYRSEVIHPGIMTGGLTYSTEIYQDPHSGPELVSSLVPNPGQLDIVFVLHPYWKQQHISFELLKQADWNLIVLDSDAVWKPSCVKFVEMITSSTGSKPDLLLSNVDPNFIKEYTGV